LRIGIARRRIHVFFVVVVEIVEDGAFVTLI